MTVEQRTHCAFSNSSEREEDECTLHCFLHRDRFRDVLSLRRNHGGVVE